MGRSARPGWSTDPVSRRTLLPLGGASESLGQDQAVRFSLARSSMIHRKALTAFEYRKYLGFWFDLGSHCSRIRRSSSIIA